MILRQLIDYQTFTYTYLIADHQGGSAMIIDPVKSQVDTYLRLLQELDLKLLYAIDTHVHADHITALGELREQTQCQTIIGAQAKVQCANQKISHNEMLACGDLELIAIYTPGHTDDSYSFLVNGKALFTGDTLLIRGSGRTDFQNGDAISAYESITQKLFSLPDDTLVYPGHDYHGQTVSTIGEEQKFNPRLQVSSAQEYKQLMDQLDLPSPQYMDVAIPANLKCGVVE